METYKKCLQGEYKNKLEYPSGLSLPAPKLATLSPSEDAIKEYQLKLANWELDRIAAEKALNNWRRENERLESQLEKDLAKEYGLENHPKRSVLWSKAWDMGHSSDYAEVCLGYANLSELLT